MQAKSHEAIVMLRERCSDPGLRCAKSKSPHSSSLQYFIFKHSNQTGKFDRIII